MVRPSSHARRQHYVPRFLLRGFAQGKGKRVAVFDKRNDRCFVAGIADVAVEQGFYDIPIEDGTATLEPGLSRLEGRAARAVNQVRRDGSLASLTLEEYATLIAFVANLFVRGPANRAQILDTMEQLRRALELMHGGREPVSDQIRELMSANAADAKDVALRLTSDASPYVAHLADKTALLFVTTSDQPFILGDNPVVMSNRLPGDPLRGNLGFAVPGIEIYVPLSERTCLAFLSNEAVALSLGAAARTDAAIGDASHSLPYASIRNALESRSSVAAPADMVAGVNQMETVFAERFLYAGSDVFAAARKLLAERPYRRSGPRMTLSNPLLDEDRRKRNADGTSGRPPGERVPP